MSLGKRVFVSGACVAMGAAMLTPGPAGAEDLGTSGVWAITVSVPDYQYVSFDCVKLPVTITVSGDIGGYWQVQGIGRAVGAGFGTAWLAADGSTTGTSQAVLDVCPEIDKSGVYNLVGTATAGSGQSTPIAARYQLLPMSSQIAVTGVTQTINKAVITGRVSANSPTLGVISGDIDGKVAVQRLKDGTWFTVSTVSLDEFGTFTADVRAIAAGGTLRAVYLGSGSAAGSVSAPAQVGLAPVTVLAKATKGNGKLHVNVNPSVKGHYYFRVEQSINGSWVALPKTYVTKGSGETLTIDLPAGTYRALVLPGKTGLIADAIGVSVPVTLTK
ncbi:MAG: hypothetical protein ACOYEV_05990 [Candidatus Nanopelagicales bacterium]